MAKQKSREAAEWRRQRRAGEDRTAHFVRSLSSWRTALALLGLTAVLVLVGFAGLTPSGPLIREGTTSRLRVVAEAPFSYDSALRTEAQREQVRKRIAPVFRVDTAPFDAYEAYLEDLLTGLKNYAAVPEGVDVAALALNAEEAARFLGNFPAGDPYNLATADLATLVANLDNPAQHPAVREGLGLLRGLFLQGVYDETQEALRQDGQALGFLNVRRSGGGVQQSDLLTQEAALRSLRVNLSVLDVPLPVRAALFRVLRAGLQPNLTFDETATAALIERAEAQVEPVRVTVREGDTIIEPNRRVNRFELEQLTAYRAALEEMEVSAWGVDALLVERALFTFVILLGAWLFLQLARMRVELGPRTLTFAAVVLVINVACFRFWLELASGNIGQTYPTLVALAPYLMPVAWGAMIITILLGATPGLLVAGMLGLFAAMMQGNALVIMLAAHLSGLIAIYHCRNIQLRARVVRAGAFSGLIMALAAVFLGLRDSLEPLTVLWQVLASLGTGFVTGTVVVGLLPIFEGLFKNTTDITLLELTDFNHPLLRKMQIEAPGSYHHSLMVANLSEHAAAAVGANPLVCRVCGLFHDIGKMVKPEYFTENQRDGHNPHLERNPSMSALIIKAHVKEGVQIAKHAKLPQVVIDAIRQHHGTSLIQYFYYKAIEEQKEASLAATGGVNAPRVELDQVNEETYRYEGPRPQTIEQAILMLADSVEAAGRSLRKVTPQSIEELVEKLIQSRLEDGQLDDSPVTLAELAKIRESFIFSLLNVLHSRVEYPKEAMDGAKKRARKAARTTTTSPFAAAVERMARESGATGPDVLLQTPEKAAAVETVGSDAPR